VTLGTRVSRGQELARLLPPPAVPGDLPQLQRARADAQTVLALATRDRERAERLTAAGAAPGKRLDEARAVEEQARAQVTAAEASLAQYNAARAGGAADTAGSFVVRAPIDGVIAQRDAATGANVTAGTILFRLVDASQIQVVGQIPEAEAGRARLVTAAEIEVPGLEPRIPAGKLATVGKVLDRQSRTVPITFAFDNRVAALPVGQAVALHLLMNTTAARPVVPAAALVDDAGRPIVFVQLEGETFERRAVTLGPRSGDLVQILSGVKPGERVVTKGAYLVRLASLSTSVPAHGHVH
jgi:RND family efflux transporter MFP subunit